MFGELLSLDWCQCYCCYYRRRHLLTKILTLLLRHTKFGCCRRLHCIQILLVISRHKMQQGHWGGGGSSQILLHPCMDLNGIGTDFAPQV